MVESSGLLNRRRVKNSTGGSNPPLSARTNQTISAYSKKSACNSMHCRSTMGLRSYGSQAVSQAPKRMRGRPPRRRPKRPIRGRTPGMEATKSHARGHASSGPEPLSSPPPAPPRADAVAPPPRHRWLAPAPAHRASGTFSPPMRAKLRYTRLARTSRSNVWQLQSRICFNSSKRRTTSDGVCNRPRVRLLFQRRPCASNTSSINRLSSRS